MTDNSLEKVKEAENGSAKIIDDANIEKTRILNEAKKKTIDILNGIEEHGAKEQERRLEKLKRDLIEERETLIRDMTDKIRNLKTDTKSKISKHVNSLFEKFLEAV